MNTPLSVRGTFTLTGPSAELDIVGRGSRVEVHVKRLRDVPALMLAILRSRSPDTPLSLLARALEAAGVRLEVVRGAWRPVDLVPVRPAGRRRGPPRLRPQLHLTRRSSPPGS